LHKAQTPIFVEDLASHQDPYINTAPVEALFPILPVFLPILPVEALFPIFVEDPVLANPQMLQQCEVAVKVSVHPCLVESVFLLAHHKPKTNSIN